MGTPGEEADQPHKKACVALARKLAVILHRMLITGEAFAWPQAEAQEIATA